MPHLLLPFAIPTKIPAVALRPNGNILVGAGSYFPDLWNLDANGAFESLFYTPNDTSTPTLQIALQSDGKILIRGSSVFARLKADGTDDGDYNYPPGYPASRRAVSVFLAPDDTVIFSRPNNHGILSSLNSDGSTKTNFALATQFFDAAGEYQTNNLNCIFFNPDGSMFLGGSSHASTKQSSRDSRKFPNQV